MHPELIQISKTCEKTRCNRGHSESKVGNMRSLKDSQRDMIYFSSPLDSLLFWRREEITRSHHYSAMLATLDKKTLSQENQEKEQGQVTSYNIQKVNKLQRHNNYKGKNI